MPKVGETLNGHSFLESIGGKGSNQAAASAKLGAHVSMIGKIGNDSWGKLLKSSYESIHINTSSLIVTDESTTGVANILVDDEGHNCIVVIPGANSLLNKSEVEAQRKTIQESKVLVCGLEVPIEGTLTALRIAKEKNQQVTTILNTAPAQKNLDDEIWKLVDIVVANETELEILIPGIDLSKASDEDVKNAAQKLQEKGVKNVVITLGARGCMVVREKGEMTLVQAEKVQAVDSTGAGDCFVGSIAFCLAQGKDISSSCQFACKVAAISVTRKGAQQSFPTLKEVQHLLS
eukprot:TRINITY_DN4328_c0_g1_i1.p1 TRINITY_DN4328_c0_g1~~TRINITY_DN4328_c0_g1_i1.p1  ORF type:complete len:291 (+),score=59.19 TRINITY_DN4328_c0_g1_i1:151-1023(+)